MLRPTSCEDALRGGLDPAQMEERQLVDDPELGALLLLAEGLDPADERRLLQLLQAAVEAAARGDVRRFDEPGAREAFAPSGEGAQEQAMVFVLVQEAGEDVAELALQWAAAFEAQRPDDLRYGSASFHEAQAIGNAAHGHEQLHQLVGPQPDSARAQEGLRFGEREGLEPSPVDFGSSEVLCSLLRPTSGAVEKRRASGWRSKGDHCEVITFCCRSARTWTRFFELRNFDGTSGRPVRSEKNASKWLSSGIPFRGN